MLQSYLLPSSEGYLQQRKARKEIQIQQGGKLCSWLLGGAKVARASRGIPVAIGTGALCNSKLKSFQRVAVKLLQYLLRGIISHHIFVGVAAALLLISAVKSLRYGNFILTPTVAS